MYSALRLSPYSVYYTGEVNQITLLIAASLTPRKRLDQTCHNSHVCCICVYCLIITMFIPLPILQVNLPLGDKVKEDKLFLLLRPLLSKKYEELVILHAAVLSFSGSFVS